MSAIEVVKYASSLVVSSGTTAIISNLIKATTPDDLKTYKKVTVGVSSIALSLMVSGMASKYTEEKIDETVDSYKKVKESMEETIEQIRLLQNKDVVEGETVKDEDSK